MTGVITNKFLDIEPHFLADDVRQSLYDDCTHWVRAVQRTGHPFMGGQRPNLADLAVYGCLNAIEGCEAFADVLKHTNIGPWFYSVKKELDDHSGQLMIKKP